MTAQTESNLLATPVELISAYNTLLFMRWWMQQQRIVSPGWQQGYSVPVMASFGTYSGFQTNMSSHQPFMATSRPEEKTEQQALEVGNTYAIHLDGCGPHVFVVTEITGTTLTTILPYTSGPHPATDKECAFINGEGVAVMLFWLSRVVPCAMVKGCIYTGKLPQKEYDELVLYNNMYNNNTPFPAERTGIPLCGANDVRIEYLTTLSARWANFDRATTQALSSGCFNNQMIMYGGPRGSY